MYREFNVRKIKQVYFDLEALDFFLNYLFQIKCKSLIIYNFQSKTLKYRQKLGHFIWS